ncbi:hypothetical protein Tco_0768693, partial [Tanacetum coccineum]
VPGSEYSEYLVPSDDEVPIEDQPLHADASPTALSPGYVADSDLEEDLKEDPANYPADEGDDDDDEEDEEEEDEDSEEEKEEEEEEHLAPADSTTLHAINPVPSTEDTEAFETDESTPTPPPPRLPQTRVPFSHTRLRRARKTVRLQPPMTASTKALIAEFAFAPTHPSPPPSPLSPWSSPLPQIPSTPLPLPSPPTHTSPTYVEAPLGYRAAKIRSRSASPLPVPSPPSLLPSTAYRDDIPEADMPLQKRARFSTLASGFEVGESSTAAARQAGLALTSSVD